MRFVKMQGAGNDYVYVDMFQETLDDPSLLAVKISDRHFGVGSDGLILIMPSEIADVRMRMFNADGSESEMCGNGIRCVAKYAVENRLAPASELHIETGRGVLALETFSDSNGKVTSVKVDMGEPILIPKDIPFKPDYSVSAPCLSQKIPVRSNGEIVSITGSVVSMGNPHCVVFVEDSTTCGIESMGPLLENHSFFPNRTNIEFVQRVAEDRVIIRTWERGAGETLACGTGASAVAVVMHLVHGHSGPLHAELKGGELTLEWNGSGSVSMIGPAVEVFRGDFPV